MKRLPVFETTKYAYKFFFANFGKFIPLLLQYSGVHLIVYILPYFIKENLDPSMESLSSILISCFLSIVECLTFWLILPIEINIIRAIVNKEKVERNFFKSLLSSRTWRVLRTVILSYLLIFIPFIIVLMIAGISYFFAFEQEHYKLLLSGLIFFGILLGGYISMRLSLSNTTSALDHDRPIRDAWEMTKGSLLRLSLVFILTILPNILLIACTWKIFKLSWTLMNNNPLIYCSLYLSNVYFIILNTSGLAHAYVHLNKYNNNE